MTLCRGMRYLDKLCKFIRHSSLHLLRSLFLNEYNTPWRYPSTPNSLLLSFGVSLVHIDSSICTVTLSLYPLSYSLYSHDIFFFFCLSSMVVCIRMLGQLCREKEREREKSHPFSAASESFHRLPPRCRVRRSSASRPYFFFTTPERRRRRRASQAFFLEYSSGQTRACERDNFICASPQYTNQ